MGNCLPVVESQGPGKSFDDFYYISREFRYLLRVSDAQILKSKYDSSIKIRKNSGVGYLNDGRIIAVGGTDNAGCFTNRAYILDQVKDKISILPSMPISTKEGSLYQYKDMVYLIGALKDSDDDEILSQEQSSPIMRYCLTSGSWEIFNHQKEKKLNFHEMIKNSQTFLQDEDNKITYRDILYPGTFMIKSKVFLVNGQKMSTRGILETLTKVYSIDLEQDDFDFKEEDLELPFKVFRPICGSYRKTAFVTGGVMTSSKHASKQSFTINFKHDPPKVQEVQGLKVDLDDTYPIIATSNSFYCISYPNIAIYNRRENTWKQFAFEKSFVNRRDVKYETPILEPEIIEGAENIKHSIKYNTLDKNVKIIEDAPDGESLSEIDVSVKIELPPGLIFKSDVNNHQGGKKKNKKKTKSSSSSSSESSEQFSF